LTCMREVVHEIVCVSCEVKKEQWPEIPRLSRRVGGEQGWIQETPCVCCGRSKYSPAWWPKGGRPGGPRAVCKICVGQGKEFLKMKVGRRWNEPFTTFSERRKSQQKHNEPE
jgi:hypothetical protein